MTMTPNADAVILSAVPLRDPRQRALIAAALRHSGGSHTVEDIRVGLAQGRYQMWDFGDSLIVTEVNEYPQLREVNFFLAAGTRATLREAQHGILAWARRLGCQRAVFTGRKGWERTELVSEDGWTPQFVTYVKPLGD